VFVLAFAIVFFFLLKNLDFSKTSLGRQAGIGGKNLTISATLFLDLPKVEPELFFRTFGINLFEILALKNCCTC